ncbi:serine acetyltransferase [bacterium (Candidatus Blackallbacteria) CG17_big_fil_post_rev_8_21_14_2_50_48_46]|uniref:Serine acetyltransferase n=1 Tax=bacterium (Candidatus Blackallbacteria) CG17_big_fil_post_rev_8_21_14_2_50_48_46 TaxID=2014261 RepID=A0A2M7G3H1_9BACT|nr:MAG: serine acetyltransferase [bacterium (Candidatus Blackallbacteria) CG18_big_fil_WC_8_21_14_2_50_49_26]PIW16257.1 MAG: serine acetyltransferase [bacterium (Candidatus Blackallbacteria) CG17_big_fil_post_rev_8_21_14_2_50_48_46]PIW49862.1 MAG: serine acetyltransferase [bacterium (Candidatus Blackallbacteria) CG13_big_fil_rev_8_21_14_2_50_49_14]
MKPQTEIEKTSLTLAERLQHRHKHLTVTANLSRKRVYSWVEDLLGILFPHLEEHITPAEEISVRLTELQAQLGRLLKQLGTEPEISALFFAEDLPHADLCIQQDAKGIWQGDPAAHSLDEVIMTYPGFLAVAIYRLAHALWKRQVPILPRMLTEHAHQLTGIDIHPGATIGCRFCIDHGTGVVIGESTWIGDDVKLYQGVTLGALSVEKSLANTKRHPSIEDRVVIYANATILGGETVIGHDTIIGGNVWLTDSVPANSLVYHKAQITVRNKEHSCIQDVCSTQATD